MPCLKDMEGSPLYPTLQAEFAQIAANIKDYSDIEIPTVVTTVRDNFGVGNPHYGYERPDIRISELVYGYRYVDPNNTNAKYDPNNVIPNDPNFHRSFAIEISNDFRKDEKFNDWRLVINNTDPNTGIGFQDIIPITSTLFDDRGGRYYVAIYQDPCALLVDLVHWNDSPADGATGVDPNVRLCWNDIWGQDENGTGLWQTLMMFISERTTTM